MNTKTANLLLLPVLAAISISAGAAPTSTDEARADAAKRNADAVHAVAPQASAPLGLEAMHVTDTESARTAAALANTASSAYSQRSEGAALQQLRIVVRDTESARAAAAQKRS